MPVPLPLPSKQQTLSSLHSADKLYFTPSLQDSLTMTYSLPLFVLRIDAPPLHSLRKSFPCLAQTVKLKMLPPFFFSHGLHEPWPTFPPSCSLFPTFTPLKNLSLLPLSHSPCCTTQDSHSLTVCHSLLPRFTYSGQLRR